MYGSKTRKVAWRWKKAQVIRQTYTNGESYVN